MFVVDVEIVVSCASTIDSTIHHSSTWSILRLCGALGMGRWSVLAAMNSQ